MEESQRERQEEEAPPEQGMGYPQMGVGEDEAAAAERSQVDKAQDANEVQMDIDLTEAGEQTGTGLAGPGDGDVHVELERDPADEASSDEERERAEIEGRAPVTRPKSIGVLQGPRRMAFEPGTQEHAGLEAPGDYTETQGNQGVGDGDARDPSDGLRRSSSSSSSGNQRGPGTIARDIMPMPTGRRHRLRGPIPAMPVPTGYCEPPPELQTPEQRAQMEAEWQGVINACEKELGEIDQEMEQGEQEATQVGPSPVDATLQQHDPPIDPAPTGHLEGTSLLQAVNHLVLPKPPEKTPSAKDVSVSPTAMPGPHTPIDFQGQPLSLAISRLDEPTQRPSQDVQQASRSRSPRVSQRDRVAHRVSPWNSLGDKKGKGKCEEKDGSATEKDSSGSDKEMADEAYSISDEELRAKIGREARLGLASKLYKEGTKEYTILEELNREELDKASRTLAARLPKPLVLQTALGQRRTPLAPLRLPTPPLPPSPPPVSRPQELAPMQTSSEVAIQDLASRMAILTNKSDSSDWEERDENRLFANPRKRRGGKLSLPRERANVSTFPEAEQPLAPLRDKRKKTSDGPVIQPAVPAVTMEERQNMNIPPHLRHLINALHRPIRPRRQRKMDVEGNKVTATEDVGEQGDDEGDGGSERMNIDSGTQKQSQSPSSSPDESATDKENQPSGGSSVSAGGVSALPRLAGRLAGPASTPSTLRAERSTRSAGGKLGIQTIVSDDSESGIGETGSKRSDTLTPHNIYLHSPLPLIHFYIFLFSVRVMLLAVKVTSSDYLLSILGRQQQPQSVHEPSSSRTSSLRFTRDLNSMLSQAKGSRTERESPPNEDDMVD